MINTKRRTKKTSEENERRKRRKRGNVSGRELAVSAGLVLGKNTNPGGL